MFFILFFVIFLASLVVTAFIVTDNDLDSLKDIIYPKRQVTFPMITLSGDIVDSKEELDLRLETLKTKLDEKKHALDETKSKIMTAVESMDKLNTTSEEIKKYYWKLKSEVARSEMDCQDLQVQIDDFQVKQRELNEEIKRSDGLYKAIFKDFKVIDSRNSSKTTLRTISSLSFPT